MDQERKFLLLKKRLDSLHYCYPLQIESSQLVEKLLNDLVKTTEGFQQLKKQLEDCKLNGAKNEQLLVPLKKENQRLVNENNQLHMSMIQIKEECEQKDNKWRCQVRMLESERNDWKFILQQKNSQEKQQENIQPNLELQQKLQSLQQQVREAESSKIILEEKAKHFEFQIDNREKEIMRLKTKLDLTGTNMDKLANDYQMEEQSQKINRQQTQIDLLTEENTRLNNEIADYRKELSRYTLKKQQSPNKQSPNKSNKKDELASFKKQLQQIEDELNQKTKQLEQSDKDKKRVAVELDQVNRELKNLKEENSELRSKAQLAEQVTAAYQADKSVFSKTVNNLKNEKEFHLNNVEKYQEELQSLQQQLLENEVQLQSLNSIKMQLDRERDLSTRNRRQFDEEIQIRQQQQKQLEQENDDLSAKLADEVQVVRQLRVEFEKMEMMRQSLMDQLQRVRQSETRKQDQGTQQQQQSQSFQVHNDDTNVKLLQQNIKELQSEYHSIVQELDRAREAERQLIVQAERAANDSYLLAQKLEQTNKQLEFNTKSKEEAMREAKDLRNMINGLKSSGHDIKNTSIKLNEKINNQDLLIADLKEQLQREQNKHHKIYQELTEAQQNLSNAKVAKLDAENQTKQLQTLAQSLEKSREELLSRLQSKNSSSLGDEKQFTELRQQNINLESIISKLQEQLTFDKKVIQQLDTERDEIQNQLDEVTEKNVQLQQQIRLMNDDLQRQQSKLLDVSAKGERGYETAQQLDEKLKEQIFKNQKLNNDVENLKYTLQIKDKDFNEMKADVQIMAKENQQLNNQIVKLSQDREIQQQQMQFLQQQELRYKEQIKMLEMEMEDLQQNYSEVCADNQRLTMSIQQLSMQHQQFMEQAQDLEKEEHFFRTQVTNFSKKEDQYQFQIVQLEREIERLNRGNQEYDKQLREVVRERDTLGKELQNNKRLASGFQSTQQDFNRQLASIDREKMSLHELNLDLQKQISLRDTQLQWENKKSMEMEQILMQERQSQMHAMEEMQALRNQNEQLIQEIERLMQGRSSAQYVPMNQSQLSSGIKNEPSQLDSSAGWDKLKQESENFKKSLTQAAVSSQYLKMKMKNLQKEYEGYLPSNKY